VIVQGYEAAVTLKTETLSRWGSMYGDFQLLEQLINVGDETQRDIALREKRRLDHL